MNFNAGDGYFDFYTYYPEEASSRGKSHSSLSDEDKRITEAGVTLFTRTFSEDEAQLVEFMRGLESQSYQPLVLAKADRVSGRTTNPD